MDSAVARVGQNPNEAILSDGTIGPPVFEVFSQPIVRQFVVNMSFVKQGKVLSDFAKRGLKQPAQPERRDKVRNCIRMLPNRDEIITNAHVDKLRAEEGI